MSQNHQHSGIFYTSAVSFLAVMAIALGGCASVKKTPNIAPVAASSTTAPKGPAKYYFSDLQILTETTTEGVCSDEKKLSQQVSEPLSVELTDEKELDGTGIGNFKYFVVNVTLEAMGFDQVHSSFTALDGQVPRSVPFGIKLRRKPGQILELTFLDQTYDMKLLTTPVYTFSLAEKRDGCVIQHNVNVFSETTGYFKKRLESDATGN